MDLPKIIKELGRKQKGELAKAFSEQFAIKKGTYQRKVTKNKFSEVEQTFVLSFIDTLKRKAELSAKEMAGA